MSVAVSGCDDEPSGASPNVSELRRNVVDLCDRYVECDVEGAVEERDGCVSGGNEEMDRLAGLTGGDCQGYVDLMNAYYACLVAADCSAYTTDAACVDESVALGDFAAASGFDCDGV